MFTRTIRAAKATFLLFITFTLTTASTAFSQNYYHKIALDPSSNEKLDSIFAPHLEVTIHQADKNLMKFRLAVFNPASHPVSITIRKGDDIYFTELIREDLYDYTFDLSSLEDGDYQILINNGKERVSRDIFIRTDTHVDRQLTLN